MKGEIITIEKIDAETIYEVCDIARHADHDEFAWNGPRLVLIRPIAVKRKRKENPPGRSGGWGARAPEL